MKLWHDDIRIPPRGWVWAVDNEAAKAALETDRVTECSLDHDLGGAPGDNYLVRGTAEETGYELVVWMIREGYLPKKINIHSMSPSGASRMVAALNAAKIHPCVVNRVPYDPKWSAQPGRVL